jgi:hypothetical protein
MKYIIQRIIKNDVMFVSFVIGIELLADNLQNQEEDIFQINIKVSSGQILWTDSDLSDQK